MNQTEIQIALAQLPLGGFRFFSSIGSTNDHALAWAREGAPDLSLVAADEQIAGRGRSGRKWFTPPGAALAFSLILRPTTAERIYPARITGLGALALVEVCDKLGIKAQIKWPNDVLLNERKVAGILVESVWMGADLEALVLGMGVNVRKASVPPADELVFPATCMEHELGNALDRTELLKDVLVAVLQWRRGLATDEFIRQWQSSLAFRGKQVQISRRDPSSPLMGSLAGLESDGSLRLLVDGKLITVQVGEIHLRPVL